jgi:uncharacterized RDD family membrane protein YckC
VSYEDRISIATPEGVDLEVTLAGLGSRFIAFLIDQTIQWGALLAIVFGGLAAVESPDGDSFVVFGIVTALSFFLLQFAYPVLFETLGSGRTPGKRWTGLRVVKVGGGPVTFLTSAIRNILRLVDGLPGLYLVGTISVLATERNQRLGDLAAGTVVVRDRVGGRAPKAPAWAGAQLRAQPSDETALWDVSAVTSEEVATVRRFLERRTTLADDARGRLAQDLALRLRPKVVGPDDDMHPEEFLLELAALKATRG